jgi:hypothetical protein
VPPCRRKDNIRSSCLSQLSKPRRKGRIDANEAAPPFRGPGGVEDTIDIEKDHLHVSYPSDCRGPENSQEVWVPDEVHEAMRDVIRSLFGRLPIAWMRTRLTLIVARQAAVRSRLRGGCEEGWGYVCLARHGALGNRIAPVIA